MIIILTPKNLIQSKKIQLHHWISLRIK